MSVGRSVALASEASPAGLTATIPATAARELSVWAHRVTSDGSSEGLPGRVTLAGDDVGPPLDHGRRSIMLPPGDVTLRLSIDEDGGSRG